MQHQCSTHAAAASRSDRACALQDDQGLEVAAIAEALVRSFNGIDEMLRRLLPRAQPRRAPAMPSESRVLSSEPLACVAFQHVSVCMLPLLCRCFYLVRASGGSAPPGVGRRSRGRVWPVRSGSHSDILPERLVEWTSTRTGACGAHVCADTGFKGPEPVRLSSAAGRLGAPDIGFAADTRAGSASPRSSWGPSSVRTWNGPPLRTSGGPRTSARLFEDPRGAHNPCAMRER